ncbi:AAA family ATPase, partial [Candidatus Micrarchaeota archaeon]|nr:AAA family ATPase [Candidatus Micrarchaeota archaeon]
MASIAELFEEFNPWWKGSYSTNLSRRPVFNKIKKFMHEKQIIVLNGLRRSGKTSIMRLLIQDLISEEEAKNIMFFSFDGNKLKSEYLENVIKEYERLMEPKKYKYIFLDEIQFVDGWEWVIKR